MERPQRPGETDDELSEPLRGQARESGLIMRPSFRTPNTLYSLEATEYAQQHGKFMEFHHAAYKAFWEDRKDIGEVEVLETIADSVGLDGADMTKALEEGTHSQTVIAQYRRPCNTASMASPPSWWATYCSRARIPTRCSSRRWSAI